MNTQEAQSKSNGKKMAIEVLCQQLQMTLTAEQVITKDGFIKNIVLYTDTEKYDIEEDQKSNEQLIKEDANLPIEEAADLRKQNPADSTGVRVSPVGGGKGEENRVE